MRPLAPLRVLAAWLLVGSAALVAASSPAVVAAESGPPSPDNAKANEWWELHTKAMSVVSSNLDQAIELDERALNAAKSTLGEHHREVANVMGTLGQMYAAKGRLADAEPLYLQALSIYEKEFKPPNPWIIHALDNLGDLYRAQKQYSKAEAAKERALAMVEQIYGKNSPYLGLRLTILAQLYREAGKSAKARQAEARIEAIKAAN